MICYRDMTFCLAKGCKHFNDGCSKAFTEEVAKAAVEWWGSDDAPVAFYGSRLDCYEESDNGQDSN